MISFEIICADGRVCVIEFEQREVEWPEFREATATLPKDFDSEASLRALGGNGWQE